MNVAVLLSVLTSARSRGSHADVAEWKSHSATMHTKTMISALVVRICFGGRACHAARACKYGVKTRYVRGALPREAILCEATTQEAPSGGLSLGAAHGGLIILITFELKITTEPT